MRQFVHAAWSPLVGAMLLASVLTASAQRVLLHPQRAFPSAVPPGNYSGITWLGGNRYAVVDDKSPTAGFYMMTLRIDSLTGALLSAQRDSFISTSQPNRDEEGICYVPARQTVFVSGEADGQVLEYDLQGRHTGHRLAIPEVFASAYPNCSLEALTYNAATHRFWTTSENTLRSDGPQPTLHNRIGNRLRLQSFDDQLIPREQYWYVTDSTAVTKQKGRSILGVSALAALDDGRIVVLEREVYIPKKKIGSFVHVCLYVVTPAAYQSGQVLQKTLLTEFRTKINLTRRSFANYEGLCVGPMLADGRRVLVLISDSQNHFRGMLKDWFRTVVLD